MTSDMPAPPQLDAPLIRALRQDLQAASYTVERVEDLMGPVAAAALRRDDPAPARRALRPLADPAALLLRLLTLGDVLTTAQVDQALPALGAQGAARLGLVGPHDADTWVAQIDLSAYSAQDDIGEIHWWIASDRAELATGEALGSEHVLGVGGASLTLARITPRDRVGTVLDLGCGSGIQALHASRHADRVVATDLSQRALAFAAFTAEVNEIELDLRHGSLFEPVAGETFDLIVSNPPFVITPRSADIEQWTYRDGGRPGDVLLAEILHALPNHLTAEGRAVMLGNWEVSAGAPWSQHPRTWLKPVTAAGIDALVIQRESEDPAQYATTWARDGGVTPRDAAWQPMIEAWLNDFAARDVEQIGFGYLLLGRRPDTASGAMRVIERPGTGSGTLAQHLQMALRMTGTLAELSDEDLLASRPVRAQDVVERRHLQPGAADPMLIELVQGAAFAHTVAADQVLAAVVGALDDGSLTLAQTLGAVCALTDLPLQETQPRVLEAIRDLLAEGMMRL
ncbi:DUF7059 domain-containing protein [Brachybacterium timonense]|uniref:DUF7059 domain-containing protein n=1 Tax=Brachybacterium timonense TaxID=2050896 RepID=UPI000D0B6D09|nr:methyltransferase [Brachybacterium timonense]